ncbi:MAG: phospholipid carrier-dependent glycosyltransferase [Cyclobacteriaceae bacterium]
MKRFGWVILLSIVSYSANFWGYPIYILDEARNTACAMEMAARQDWVVPTFNNELRTDKPPLHYFFMRAAYAVFDVTPFSARLFSIIMGVLTVCVVYFFTTRLVNETTAWLASLILIASLQMIFQFHLAVPDPYLIFFFTLGMFSFVYAWRTHQKSFFYLTYAALAMAFMAKGPLAPALAGLTVLLFLILRKEFGWRTLSRIQVWGGAVLFLAIVLPWWIAVTIKTEGEWTRGFFFEHNLQRFSSSMEGHTGIPGLAIAYFLAAMLPLGFFVPGALVKAWKARHDQPVIFFLGLSALAVVGFFSLSRTILPGYLSPAVPFAAVVLAWKLEQLRQVRAVHHVLAGLLLLISAALPVAGFLALQQDPLVGSEAPQAFWILIALPGVVAGWYYLWKNQVIRFVYATLIGYGIMGVLLFYLVMPRLMRHNPVELSVATLPIEAQTPVACFVRTNAAYVFNLRRTYPYLGSPEAVQRWLAANPDGLILTRDDEAPALEHLNLQTRFTGRDLFENHTTVVLGN